jgi:plastocyanin
VTRTVLVVAVGGLFVAGLAGPSCTDDSGVRNPGQAGSGGGGGGAGGGAGGSTAGSGAGTSGSGGAAGTAAGGTPGFMSIAPCPNEGDYVAGPTNVDFGLMSGALTYAPKCLKVSIPRGMLGTAGQPGTNITFTGDFAMHPLEPSANRGTQSGNPITSTSAAPDGGTSKTFRFESPGYFAYFCDTHNPSDNGAAMSGVVWAVVE